MIPEHIVDRGRNPAGCDPLGVEKGHKIYAVEHFLRIVCTYQPPDYFRIIIEHQAAAVSHLKVKRDRLRVVPLPMLEVLEPDTAVNNGAIGIRTHVLLIVKSIVDKLRRLQLQ